MPFWLLAAHASGYERVAWFIVGCVAAQVWLVGTGVAYELTRDPGSVWRPRPVPWWHVAIWLGGAAVLMAATPLLAPH